MSALAQVLLALGRRVTGSDRFHDQGERLEVLARLRAAGVEIVPQDGSAVHSGLSAVVVSTAIEESNPDLQRARALGVPVLHRAGMLAQIVRGRRLVAVTGTSGKTTVTGMIGWILDQAGRDPSVVNGGALVNWRSGTRIGNVRMGRSDLWVIEADESDRSLLRFDPDWSVITNASADHFSLSEAQAVFREFAAQTRRAVVCGPGISGLLRERAFPCARVDVPEPAEVRLQPRLGFRHSGVAVELPLMGRHNIENAAAAITLCAQLGVRVEEAAAALAAFHGIERRLQIAGVARGVTVVDEYAHNPAKIAAAWDAVKTPAGRVLGVWRPHGYGPLALMMADLVESLARVCGGGDAIFILPVFYAGGTAARSVVSDDLVVALRSRGVAAEPAPDYEALMSRLLELCRAGDVVLCMGARDPNLPRFARRLVERIEQDGAARSFPGTAAP